MVGSLPGAPSRIKFDGNAARERIEKERRIKSEEQRGTMQIRKKGPDIFWIRMYLRPISIAADDVRRRFNGLTVTRSCFYTDHQPYLWNDKRSSTVGSSTLIQEHAGIAWLFKVLRTYLGGIRKIMCNTVHGRK